MAILDYQIKENGAWTAVREAQEKLSNNRFGLIMILNINGHVLKAIFPRGLAPLRRKLGGFRVDLADTSD